MVMKLKKKMACHVSADSSAEQAGECARACVSVRTHCSPAQRWRVCGVTSPLRTVIDMEVMSPHRLTSAFRPA